MTTIDEIMQVSEEDKKIVTEFNERWCEFDPKVRYTIAQATYKQKYLKLENLSKMIYFVNLILDSDTNNDETVKKIIDDLFSEYDVNSI